MGRRGSGEREGVRIVGGVGWREGCGVWYLREGVRRVEGWLEWGLILESGRYGYNKVLGVSRESFFLEGRRIRS